jgi:site-specific recombinase XerC
MDTTDVSPKADAIKVWGKGSKERTVYLTQEMAERLRLWMGYRSKAMSAAGLGDNVVLFPSLYGLRQQSMQIGERFRTMSARAAVTPPLTAHSLRHMWTGRHAKANTNVFLLKQMGGWSDMGIVMTYVGEMSGEDAARANQNASAVKDIVGRRVPRRQRDGD